MRTVYLHIGTHKTGTTTLQHFLSRAGSALKEQGFLYPKTGRSQRLPHSHHKLAWSIRSMRGVSSLEAWYEVFSEIEQWEGRGAIISAEDFWPCTDEEIRTISQLLGRKRIEVIMYVRNPIDYILSRYKQHLLSAGHKTLDVYLRESVKQCDYLSPARRWKEHSGVDAFHLRLFDKVKRPDHGLERDFIDCLNISFKDFRQFASPPINVSPEDEALQLARLISKTEHHLTQLLSRTREISGVARRLRKQIYNRGWIGHLLLNASRPFLTEDLAETADSRTWQQFCNEISGRHEAFLRRFVDDSDREYLKLQRPDF